MALGEKRTQVQKWWNKITEVSRTGWTAQDVYYGMDNSFQYSSNINTDDEMHGIKLATKTMHTNNYAKCQLVSLGEHGVMALPIDTNDSWNQLLLKRFHCNWQYAQNMFTEDDNSAGSTYNYKYDAVPWVVFQDRFWFGYNKEWSLWEITAKMSNVPLAVNSGHWSSYQYDYEPYDHNEYSDESIENPDDITWVPMMGLITAILNYNNTRLVVAAGQDIWVYYPELDHWTSGMDPADRWKMWWKKVLTYEAWVTVVALTCTFEYLKVWAVDEWWNTKVYYYQGNNNLRSTFVYNLVDLTGVRVLHVYSINGIDYYTSSICEYASDALIDFNKMVGVTPVKLFTQRAWLTTFDINNKAPYFVWPTSIAGAYNNGNIYVADAFWVFSFKYTPDSYDRWYMKWKLRDTIISWKQVYWLCENKWFLYVSDSDGCRAMRLYDTGVDGYQEEWVLISREFEWREGWTITKMLDQIRLNYELNPMTDHNGNIDIYVSPNNLRKSTSVFTEENNRWHVMHIEQRDIGSRTQKSDLVNNLQSWESAFKFDRQTITYAIVISKPNGSEPKTTPIVRQIDIKYHAKDKVNNVYDIN